MIETLQQIRAAVMNGLTRPEIEGLLGRKLDGDEVQELNKVKAVLKLKEKDKERQEEAAKAERKTKNVFGKMVELETLDKTPAQIPKARFKQAIWQSFGNMSALARLLEVNYTSLRSYLADHKDLDQLMKDARRRLVDSAEEYITGCLADDSLDPRCKIDLAKFILKTQGKENGWTEQPTVATQINVANGEVDIKSIFGV